MAKAQHEVHAIFRDGFGARARIELVRCAERSHRAARDLVRSAGFASAQARDVMPYVWRADCESRMRSIIVPGVAVRDRQNIRGTSNFVEMMTDTVTVTALTRSRAPTRLPQALYRQTRAELSQLALFAEADEVGDRLYGVYVYGGDKDGVHHARIYFPIPRQPLLAIDPIDLLAEQADVLQDLRAETETVRPTEHAVEVVVGLKRKLAEEAE